MVIKEQFKLIISKYNFDEAFMAYKKVFDAMPSEEEIKEVIVECNNKYPEYVRYYHKIIIEHFFSVDENLVVK